MGENKINSQLKLKIFLKKIFYLNFFTRFVGRILLQRFYKTYRLFTDSKRLKGTIWVEWHKELFDTWAINKNKDLYYEAANFYVKFKAERNKIIKGLPISGGNNKATGGGGANETLLYFLVRLIKAKNVLETGVSAGSSSRTILEALKINGNGKLYSSDLAIHLKKEQVGVLVSKSLHKDWFLTHEGDNQNLPIIFKKENRFDLIYYDSEKTYNGKKKFHSEILKLPTPKIIVYDDIDRDSFFSESVKFYGYKYKIFNNAGVIFNDEIIKNNLSSNINA